MSKFKDNFRSHLKAYIITGVIALIIGVVIFLLFYFLREKSLKDAMDGCTIAFVSLFGCGALMWLANLGTFDLIAYGFKQLFTSAFAKKANKYNDYGGYLQDKRVSRSTSANLHYSFIFVSFLFGIALAILAIIMPR